MKCFHLKLVLFVAFVICFEEIQGKLKAKKDAAIPSGIRNKLNKAISQSTSLKTTRLQNYAEETNEIASPEQHGLFYGGYTQFVSKILSEFSHQIDLDTMVLIASVFGRNSRTDLESNQYAELLLLQKLLKLKCMEPFTKSDVGSKVQRVIPKLIQADSLYEQIGAIISTILPVPFSTALRVVQDRRIHELVACQAANVTGHFVQGFNVSETVSMDIGKVSGYLLKTEILEPMTFVWDAYSKAVKHHGCASYVFCQLNKDFGGKNAFRRSMVQSGSVLSAYEISQGMRKRNGNAFQKMFENIERGFDGFDCSDGVSDFCLNLTQTPAPPATNELK